MILRLKVDNIFVIHALDSHVEQTSEGQFAEVVLVEPDLKGLLSAATKERFAEELQRRVEARKRECAQGLAGLQPGARSSVQCGDTTTRRNQFQFINFSRYRRILSTS